MGKPVDDRRGINNAHRLIASLCQHPEKRARYEQQFVKQLPPKRNRLRRPVDGRLAGPTEHQEQCAVISWWALAHRNYALPQFALFAVPNGGARDVITGARLKAEGVRRGTPDLILAAPRSGFHGLFLELKVGSNQPSPEQKEFIAHLEASGYSAAVYWSSEDAIKAIEAYLS